MRTGGVWTRHVAALREARRLGPVLWWERRSDEVTCVQFHTHTVTLGGRLCDGRWHGGVGNRRSSRWLVGEVDAGRCCMVFQPGPEG